MKLILPLVFSFFLVACQTSAQIGETHCPPVPQHLLVDEKAPVINLSGNATNEQVIEEGIRPLYQWGAEGWARLRQVRQLQEQCRDSAREGRG